MEIDLEISDEEYVIEKAKSILNGNPIEAKAWMLTAKTLYPNNFSVQFEAYMIEKKAGHVKEAAKCFSELISKFQQQPELWKEVEKVTAALRAESNSHDTENQFLCEMFRHISSEVQHKLLLFTAEHCEDTMEHCRLLLLLLQRFPTAISNNGPRLVETLISAEKHSVDGHYPINAYRRLLVCDLLPLLASEDIKIELSSKMLYKLLHKAIEFYLYYLGFGSSPVQDSDLKIEEPWIKLFGVLEFIGNQLNWEPYLINFGKEWSKEEYWQRIMKFYQTKSKVPLDEKQLLFCVSLFFLKCLHEYIHSLTPESSPGQTPLTYLMVEAFNDPSLPGAAEPKGKKRRNDAEIVSSSLPQITVEKPDLKSIQSSFLICLNCWDLLNSCESLQREFIKLNANLKLDPLLSGFVIDYALYKGLYDEALMFLQKITDPDILLQKFIRISGILYVKKNYSSCFEPILLALPHLPVASVGTLSSSLIIGGTQKHLHYLPLTKKAVLQYLVKILLRCIRDNMHKSGSYNELAIGHIFVLIQLDWPQEEDMLPPLLEQIHQHKSFQYHFFQSYIINVEILEELTYLWTNQGGQVQLDILPHLGHRRIGTRGADKGVKEEIRQAIRRQIARSNENIDDLIITFITNERTEIIPALL
ncbi:unnamed protein product [Acanthoscelides obtectus]|uniref:Integrator complex subunit 10 n=2 Tax=Acanthoscelides obtectus TaxID=200917 RepID=A0A9P0PPC7_ACAOB|nr:unnamed protein product [Acanthoscelides obtectus]CAK1670044.1 Integrator complex subunit 10 [Acanthoscelides obtectus]